MNDLSINGEPVFLREGHTYLVIDVFYLTDIRLAGGDVDLEDLKLVKEKVFPHCPAPFALVKKTGKGFFPIAQQNIKSVNNEKVDDSYFVSDTGLAVFFKRDDLSLFVNQFYYDLLVEGNLSPVNIAYWNDFKAKAELNTCALVLAQGINSGNDFTGSGFYTLSF